MKAQENEEQKVGLVLSGGGAKGFAHIGVLKVIDSLGIKIDYVAGTSMGAIIGSLYASGYSGEQLEALFNTINFDELINDKFPRGSKPFYERENAEKYAVSLPFDNFKIRLPSGLSRGQNVYNLLYQLMLPVSDISDFGQLPIPFFCVATDMETGASVILDQGRLAEAVAASGALPSLFQPVTIDNRIYLDGGVTNNFPVEQLRAKGMDIVIGVDVQNVLKDRASLKSAADILLQVSNFRTIDDMERKVPLTDVYIKPDITNFSVISFDEGRDIIANGEAAAQLNIAALENIKLYQRNEVNKPTIKPTDSLKIKTIAIKGDKSYSRSYLLGKLKFRNQLGISYDDFKKGVNNLIATNNFETFRYDLEPNTDGSYNLKGAITASETSMFLKLGIHYDELYKSAILANLTKKGLLFSNDIAALDVILGDNTRYNLDYFIDKGFYLSIGLKSSFNQFKKNISPLVLLRENVQTSSDINKINARFSDFTNQLYVQTIFRKDFALRAGAEHKRLKITSETLIDTNQEGGITFDNTDYLSLFGHLIFDDYDNALFPNSGFYFNGDFHLYFSASGLNEDFEEFSIAKADLGYAFSLNDRVALNIVANGGLKIGGNTTKSLDFGLGGYANNFINNFNSFYGYDFLALYGDSFVKATFTLDYELFVNHHLQLAANYANIANGLFKSAGFLSTPDYSGYALGYALETFLGPLEAKYTYSPETGSGYWFFNLGFWF